MRTIAGLLISLVLTTTCEDPPPTSDQIQQEQQERILKEGTAALGMPNIKNFRERRLFKDIQELCDQEGLITYTYLFSEQTGTLKYLGESIGFGIPYATEYTNPQKLERVPSGNAYAWVAIPQADPNGLFKPASAEGTWVMLKDPDSKKVSPVYIEPRIVVSPFKLKL